MITQVHTGTLEQRSIARAEERAATLSLSRVVGTLQVVLATRRAARFAERPSSSSR
jgi:hypothetical protein